MTGERAMQVFEVPGKWGHIRVEKTSGNEDSLCLHDVTVAEGFNPHDTFPVIISEGQWSELKEVVEILMGWKG